MSGDPAVSVVLCFLDSERFLRDAIESVFAQTFRDWELVLVDDGSRDGSASRNLGLAEARGRYVAFLDADDVWLPEKLERQVGLLEREPEVAMTYGPTRRWYGWTGRPADARRDLVYPTMLPHGTTVRPPELLTLYLRSGGAAVPGICSLLVRREAAKEVGGFDDRFRGLFEDQVFLARIALRHAVLVTDDCTAFNRQHEASCCAGALQRGEYDPFLPNPARGRYLQWLRERIDELGCGDRALRSALRRELRPYRHPVLAWPYARLPWLARRARRGAKPLLERHGAPATVFVATAGPRDGRPFWWDELEGLLSRASERSGGRDPSAESGRDALREALHRRLGDLEGRERDARLAALRARIGAPDPVAPADRALGRDEPSRLAAGGLVEIGAHTVSHPKLPALTPEAQEGEVRGSRDFLVDVLGAPVTSFAYPHGLHRAETRRIVREAGFARACTSAPGVVRRWSDPLRLCRMEAPNCDGERFARWLHGLGFGL